MNIQELIFNLCTARGVSGDENAAASVAERYVAAFAETSVDRNGNVIAVCGNPSAEKTILLDAHLDQIGLIVTDINDNGFVKVAACGGIDVRTIQNEVFEAKDGARGTVCCLPPHLSDGSESKAEPISKVWLDFGMSREEVLQHLAIGDTLTFSEKPEMLLDPADEAAANCARVQASSDAAPARCTVAKRGVRILRACVSDEELSAREVRVMGKRVFLGCAKGSLEVLEVKPDGKRAMEASAWAAGLRDAGEWAALK